MEWMTYFPTDSSSAEKRPNEHHEEKVKAFAMYYHLLYFIDDIIEEFFCSFTEVRNKGFDPLDSLVKQFENIWSKQKDYVLEENDENMIDSIPKYQEMLESFEEFVEQVRKVASPEAMDQSPFIQLWSIFIRSTSWYADKKDSVFKSESTFRYIR
jgi:hypothetical protein